MLHVAGGRMSQARDKDRKIFGIGSYHSKKPRSPFWLRNQALLKEPSTSLNNSNFGSATRDPANNLRFLCPGSLGETGQNEMLIHPPNLTRSVGPKDKPNGPCSHRWLLSGDKTYEGDAEKGKASFRQCPSAELATLFCKYFLAI